MKRRQATAKARAADLAQYQYRAALAGGAVLAAAFAVTAGLSMLGQ
jgi:hypothetical protein